MIQRFLNVGKLGIIADQDNYDLDPNAWSNSENVRFIDGNAERFTGHSQVFGTITIAPYWALPVPTASTYYWLYSGLQRVYVTDGSTKTEITYQEPAPGACTATLGSGAGNLSNGAYKYKVTFVNAQGETEAGTVSNTVTVVDYTVNGKISVSAIPLGGTGTTARKLYRTAAAGSTYKLLTTISDNVTTTYADNTADASLGATAPSTNSADILHTGSATDIWCGGVISGIPVISNGKDGPVQWNPVSTGNRMTSLPWTSTATWRDQGYYASFVRPFRQFLVAGDTTEGGTRYPYRLRWSTEAGANTTPTTWDDTDTTEDAGYTEFAESGGFLVDSYPLRDVNIVYKEDSTHLMSFIGGNDVFNFLTLFKTSGLLSKNCVCEFFGKHLCLTNGDVIVHDGNSMDSIVNKRMQKWLFNQIDATYYVKSFVVPNYPKNEVWICFPSSGSTWSDTALVWNYRDNTFGVREIPSPSFIAFGIVDPSENQTWDADSGYWDSDSTTWDQRLYNPTQSKLLMVDPTNSKFFIGDDTNQFNGVSYTAFVEKLGMDLGDPTRIKTVKRIYPRISSSVSVTVKIGTEMTKDSGMSWTAYNFDPTSDKIDVLKTGRFFGIRVESSSVYPWTLHSFDIEYEYSGKR